jgi:selenocysteine-specific elongation factor
MTVVIGTAGHIDHGKTTLLRALTGIDADRLPEERRRGMTIDVGYAHLTLPDGTVIDFVDVPGHDRLVGNMLVGAGEIDASMLVIAADDGPRAQTHEHLGLLRALGLAPRLVVVTKVDAVEAARVDAVVAAARELVDRELVGHDVPVIAASGLSGVGVDALGVALARIGAAVRTAERPATLAIDRVFAVKGRGTVVTGTLRGGPLTVGDRLRLVPGDGEARVREIQVHGSAVERVQGGGRTALNLAGPDLAGLGRGQVLTADGRVTATDRFLAALPDEPADRTRWRLHVGTASAEATIGRSGRDALRGAGIVRLTAPVAARPGDRFVLRRAGSDPVGGTILDARPPRGPSRRRQTLERVADLMAEVHDPAAHDRARLELHGALVEGGRARLAEDVMAGAAVTAVGTVGAVGDGAGLGAVRAAVAGALRRSVTLTRDDAALVGGMVVDRLVADGRLSRDGDALRSPGVAAAAPDPARLAAMDRLEAALATPTPPPLSDAARAAGCPPDGIRALERDARIVVLEADLAYAMTTYRELAARALAMAAREPLTPAAFRDATGTSRKYVMAILEDLDRRAILRRTPAGHVPGPKAPAATTRV